MNTEVAKATRKDLDAMREAKRELGQAESYLSTKEAVEEAPLELCEETPTAYPTWVCPRTRKNPARKNSPLLWDRRDIRALPLVLRQWETARKRGREDEFRERRKRLLRERDEDVLREIYGGVR